MGDLTLRPFLSQEMKTYNMRVSAITSGLYINWSTHYLAYTLSGWYRPLLVKWFCFPRIFEAQVRGGM